MSYSVENKTINELKDELDYYAHMKTRVSQDHFRLKMVLTAQVGRSHPKSDLKLIGQQFYAVLDDNSQQLQKRIGTMEDAIHLQIAKLIQDGQKEIATDHR